MNIKERLAKRYAELQDEMNSLPSSRNSQEYYETVPWRKWATSAMHLLEATFGEISPHYINFNNAYSQANGYKDDVDIMKGIFQGAKADFDGGYLFSVEAEISGEIFGDFVGLAKVALDNNQKDVAVVLACAALEDTLKRFAVLHGLDVDNKEMQQVVAAIKSKGLVTGAQKTLLDAMPKIRDYAMHANWEKITSQDVGSVIGYVEQFLLTHFA